MSIKNATQLDLHTWENVVASISVQKKNLHSFVKCLLLTRAGDWRHFKRIRRRGPALKKVSSVTGHRATVIGKSQRSSVDNHRIIGHRIDRTVVNNDSRQQKSPDRVFDFLLDELDIEKMSGQDEITTNELLQKEMEDLSAQRNNVLRIPGSHVAARREPSAT